MIFVILGTQKFPFTRLIKEIERLKKENIIIDKVVVQAGYTLYESKSLIIKDFMDEDVFSQNIENANIVITHGGTGAIINSLKKRKKVIAVPRLSKYGEHVDDHQQEIVETFVKKNYILESNVDDLSEKLEMIKTYQFDEFKSNTDHFLDIMVKLLKDS